jgi:uncharacterized repeat protein (TIGR01451 family)
MIKNSTQKSILLIVMVLFFSSQIVLAQSGLDLSTVMTASPATVNSGSNVNFAITVTGPTNATGVTVTTMLPKETTFVLGTPTCSHNRGTVTCVVGALTSGTANVAITASAMNLGASSIIVKTVAGVVGDQHDANMSNNSATASITISGSLAAPSNLVATAVSPTQINLSWTDNSNNETGFVICVGPNSPSPCTPLPVLPANTTSYAHTGLVPATSYRYNVRAVRNADYSDYSNEVVATTQCAPLPAPSLTVPAHNATNISVSPDLDWSNVTNAQSYEVQVSTNSAFSTIDRCMSGLTASAWQPVTPSLSHGTIYYWRARAISSCGSGTWSAYRGFTTLNTVLKPNALLVNASGNGVFEPGETAVIVAPEWRNPTATPVTNVTGTIASFGGPGAPTNYTITDSTASYGNIGANSNSSCQTSGNCYSLTLGNPTRPVQHWDAKATENLSNGNTMSWTLHIGKSFNDVPTTNPYYSFIETIFHNGITAGCGSNNFCPTAVVTRDQIAPMLLVSKDGRCYTPPTCVAGSELFSDVPASNPFCSWIEEIADRGVTSGCGGNNYCPSAPITRDQISIFLLKAKEGGAYVPPACVAGSEMFTDVPASNPFCRYIEEIARRGATSGCGGGNYCPTAVVTRDQLSVFLSKIFNLTLYKP